MKLTLSLLEKGQDLVVWGSGKPLRQFIYSLDLAELLIWTLDHYEDGNIPLILSVSEEDEVSIGDVVRMIGDAMDFKGKIIVFLSHVSTNILLIGFLSLIQQNQMDNSKRRPLTKNC